VPWIVIAVIVIAGIIGNVYTYQLATETVKNLRHEVETLQTRIAAFEDALGNYSWASVDNVSLSELYEEAKDSVVLIRGETTQGAVSGSGFVYEGISGQMVINTNFHVVQGVTSLSVTFRNGHAYSAQVLGSDAYVDLAVLSVGDAPPEMLKPLPIVSSSLLEVGDLVIAIGNPYELVGSMTTGVVSQVGRAIPEEMAGGFSIANVIQISAPINPGNSGGPLLNAKGQVVGVTFAIIEESTGVGFAIPSDTILREISYLVDGDVYPHSWMGVMGMDMTYELAQNLGTTTTYGWLIVDVDVPSPAATADLRAQDIILALEGPRAPLALVINGDAISSYLEEHTRPDDIIMVTVEREGNEIALDLELGTRPAP